MQSADFGQPFNCDADFLQCQKVLQEFEDGIQRCIDKEDWEKLTVVLESRQKYLEDLRNMSLPDHQREALKALLLRIVTKNDVFQKIISQQKNTIFQQQLALGQRQRAIDMYK